jgi:thiol-disulfide isomerase/thioredoxin
MSNWIKQIRTGMKKILCLLGLCIGAISVFADDPEILEIGDPEAEVLTVVFFANHCPTAQAYEERMKMLSSEYGAGQMQMVAISSNYPEAVCLEELGYSDLGDSFDEMKIRASEMEYNFPYVYDGDTQEVAKAYGAVATPHVFIFDRERKLRYRGRIDNMEDPYQKPTQLDAKNAIEALLSGNVVPVETTRAFGCSMKWKSKMGWRKKLDADWANKPVEVEGIDLVGLENLLSNQGESIRLINFWATWCGPCVIEFPEFVDMQRMYGQRNFEVVSISMDQFKQQEKVLKFLEERQAAFPNYMYTEKDREELFELVDPNWQGNIPYTLIVKPGGDVVYRHDGIIEALEVRKSIIELIGKYFADD